MVFGVIPVSVFACLLYIASFVSMWITGIPMRWFRMLTAWVLIGAACWFTALQLFVVHTICPYCMTMHGLGTLIGGLILYSEFKVRTAITRAMTSLMAAMILVAGLAAVQYFGPAPETHLVNDVTVDFLEGRTSYSVDELPHVGPTNAEHIIVKYFDYTCGSCKTVHRNLEKFMAKYPGKLAVIVLPVPLNKQCNSNLPIRIKNHRNACEFARLSLAVWRADQSKFKEFHQWLFKYHEPPYEAVRAMAYSLVGAENMEAVNASWGEAVLQENIADYKILIRNTPVMPKLLLGGSTVMQGATKDSATFELLLKQHLGF